MYATTGNLRLVQKINRSLVLNLIKDKGPISRADISKTTKLTRSTVSNIVDYLIQKDLIKEIGLTSSGVGSRAILLKLNSQAYHAIGVDLGTLHTTVAITDLLGRVETKMEYPTGCQKDKDKIIEKLLETIHNIVKSSGIEWQKIVGIGVAAPGLIDKYGTMLITPNFGWRDTPLGGILRKQFHIPVFVDNNVNAMALAESEFGAGQGVRNFVFINVEMGIGAGVVINGELFHGKNNCTGEIGHTTVDYNGPKCSCGNNGCLEVMASGPAIAKRAFSVSAKVAKIIPVSLGKDCTVIGAANLALKEMLKITKVVTFSNAGSIR